MKKKIKLRDLTKEQYQTWLKNQCDFEFCGKCPFKKIDCLSISTMSWINNKDIYKDKFLDQEIEIEVEDKDKPLLTKKEKEYLENLLTPFKEVVEYVIKNSSGLSSRKEYICIKLCNGEYITLPYFNFNEYYKNLEIEKEYTLEELRLFQNKYKITLTEFWNSKDKLAIHCDTEEKANKLLKAFDKLGKKWRSGDPYLKYNLYELHVEKTCYSNRNTCDDVSNYKEDNVTIYEFDEVDLEN